jgi:hypothetical protein
MEAVLSGNQENLILDGDLFANTALLIAATIKN